MKEILEKLFSKSIALGAENYTEEQIKSRWLGNSPANLTDIKKTENRLGIKLPQDYIEMVTISNGFPTCSNSIESSFEKVDQIDFYRNYEWNVIDTYKEEKELDDVVSGLERVILIAEEEEEQQFLLVPPISENEKWRYWKLASWIPGEEVYQNLNDYLKSVIEFLDEEIKGEVN